MFFYVCTFVVYFSSTPPICAGYLIEIPGQTNIFGLANTLSSVLFSIRAMLGVMNISGDELSFKIEASGYGNVIPKMIQPRHTSKCFGPAIHVDAIYIFLGCCPETHPFVVPRTEDSFQLLHNIFSEYFQIGLSNVQQIPPGTLGLHYRGTDRMNVGDAVFLSPTEFLVLLNDFLSHNWFQTIYVASDTNEFVELIYRTLPEKRLLSLNQIRATAGSAVGLHFQVSDNGTNSMADAAMADLLALSRCSCIFKTASTFSAFAKVLNPNLELVTVTAAGLRAPFPENVLSNEYEGHSARAKLILNRTLQRPSTYDAEGTQVKDSICRSRSLLSDCPF